MAVDYSNNALIARQEAGEHLEFVFFWNESTKGLDPRRFFNQWHFSKFTHKHFHFEHAEQAMMAEKALLFDDIGTLFKILEAKQPHAVKALGREVKGYTDALWHAERYDVVLAVNIAKFKADKNAREALLATGDKILVEASPFDDIWGIKMAENHQDIQQVRCWKGLNLLGQVLMEVRDIFRDLKIK